MITEQLVALLRLKNDIIAKLQDEITTQARIDPIEHGIIIEKLQVCSFLLSYSATQHTC